MTTQRALDPFDWWCVRSNLATIRGGTPKKQILATLRQNGYPSIAAAVETALTKMKKQQIQLGRRYTDDKGNVREVIAEGPQYRLYDHQAEEDNLRYRVVKRTRGPNPVGTERNSTRAAFAAWARHEVEP